MIKKNELSIGAFALAMMAALYVWGWSIPKADAKTPPTTVSVTNDAQFAVYANLVLGQPPIVRPPHCVDLGKQIKNIKDTRLVFTSNKGKTVKFTPQNAGITTQGYYFMEPGETITYQPKTFSCTNSAGACSPAVTFNFFFTKHLYNGNPNNGCSTGGLNTRFPNATNLGEASINFGINDHKNAVGATDGLCANADSADISAVNGVNARIEVDIREGNSARTNKTWPFYQAENEPLKGSRNGNKNRIGVFGWAATDCVDSAGYPNPKAGCAAPLDAPRAVNGLCATLGGDQYSPIADPNDPAVQYCAELSDTTHNYCNIQRTGNITGGKIAITFKKFYTED